MSPYANINAYLSIYYGSSTLNDLWAKLKLDLQIELEYTIPYPLKEYPEDIEFIEDFLAKKIQDTTKKTETSEGSEKKECKNKEKKPSKKTKTSVQIMNKKEINSIIKIWHPDLNFSSPVCNLITKKINMAKESKDMDFLNKVKNFTNLINNY